MRVLQPRTWEEALETKAAQSDALPIQGGTDVMVELNFDRVRPDTVLDLSRIETLREHGVDGDVLWIGAGVTYTRIVEELGSRAPGLAMAARTVGSPQIRNRGTVGGNLGAASPAGDSHPPLLASGAEVEAESVGGRRRIAIADFYVGPKRSALRPDELIAGVRVPSAAGGQQFAKIGPRNAMVIATCSFALALDGECRRVGTGIGSAGPTPLRALEAERFLENVLEEEDAWDSTEPLGAATAQRFSELVAEAARPIDDVRGTADYRVHALGVLARRTLAWAREERPPCG